MKVSHIVGIAAICLVGSNATARSGSQLLKLVLTRQLKKAYHIHRVWRAVPPNSGNGNQIHDMEAEATLHKTKSGNELELAVTRFSGIDLSGGESKHLREIAPEVQRIRIARSYSGNLVQGGWSFVGRSGSGWAGMMTAKALGMYEVGFFELAYPEYKLSVGEQWNAKVLVGNEGLRAPGVRNLKGTPATCTYSLRSIDLSKRTATIRFLCSARITYEYKAIEDGRVRPIVEVDEQSGLWTVSLTTGMPLRFHTERKVATTSQGHTEVESTTTDVRADP